VKIDTSTLEGPALDWAVAKAEGYDEWGWDREVSNFWMIRRSTQTEHWLKGCYEPSTVWRDGGPIIDREQISVLSPTRHSMASEWRAYTGNKKFVMLGSTALIAAMRCFVASKLGDEVDIPEELLK
jgi:Protein of unknown function (DUF2591)